MDDPRVLRGTELRYALTIYLGQHGPSDIATLIAGLGAQGFVIGGYPPKSVSDALRWEMRHCRVMRRARGIYAYWEMPRSTEYRIHRRVLALREQAEKILYGGDSK
jgi:hypothetical protein